MAHCRCHYRRNADEDVRSLERLALQGDSEAAAKWVAARFRLGEIPLLHVEIAARLGHPIARQILPSSSRSRMAMMLQGLATWNNDVALVVFGLLVPQYQSLVAKIVAAYARHVLPLFEKVYDIDLPRSAIQVILQWADDPTETNRLKTHDIGDQLYEFLEALDPTPSASGYTWEELHAATSAFNAAFLATRAAQTEDAVEGAAGTARNAVIANGYSFGPVRREPNSSAWTQEFLKGEEQEARWQANFLAEVLLGLQSVDGSFEAKRNPDEQIRKLERQYQAEYTEENQRRLNAQLERLGQSLVPHVVHRDEGWTARTTLADGRIVSSVSRSHDGWWGINHATVMENDMRWDAWVDLGDHLTATTWGNPPNNVPPNQWAAFRDLPKPTKEQVIASHLQVVEEVRKHGPKFRQNWEFPKLPQS